MKEPFRIAHIDDDTEFLGSFAERVERHLESLVDMERVNPIISKYTSPIEFIEKLQMGEIFDLIFLDIEMPRMSGIEAVNRIKTLCPKTEVIMISAHANLKFSVETVKYGAKDYLAKPVLEKDLRDILEQIIQRLAIGISKTEIQTRVQQMKRTIPIIGESPVFEKMMLKVAQYSYSDSSVLILGENGTGKELVAKALHKFSPRSKCRLVDINVSAIQENLVESELFGYEKGAFTGATKDKKGLFEQAHRGTLFLDEIGDLKRDLQSKLLRAVQERKIHPVGHTQNNIPVDVRLIAATNKDLPAMIGKDTFGEDLFHRLNVLSIRVPALHERKEDIPSLIDYFLQKHRSPSQKLKRMSAGAIIMLSNFNYSGNIRQLSNVIERLLVLCESDTIALEDVQRALENERQSSNGNGHLELVNRAAILEILAKNAFNKRQAASDLGVSRNTLYKYIKDFNIVDPRGVKETSSAERI